MRTFFENEEMHNYSGWPIDRGPKLGGATAYEAKRSLDNPRRVVRSYGAHGWQGLGHLMLSGIFAAYITPIAALRPIGRVGQFRDGRIRAPGRVLPSLKIGAALGGERQLMPYAGLEGNLPAVDGHRDSRSDHLRRE